MEDFRDHGALSGLILDRHAESAVTSAGGRVELGQLMRTQQLGIGILKLGDESSRGLLIKRGLVDGVDVP